MKTTILKNTTLFVSGMVLATSVSIFASNNSTSIEANLVNLAQYVKELYITSTGTPAGDVAFSVSHAEDGKGQVQADGYFTSIFTSGDVSSTIGIQTSEDGPRGHMMTLDSGNMANTIGFDKAPDQILTTLRGVDTVNGWGSVLSASSLGTTSKYVVFDNYSNELRVDDAGITFWFEDNIQNNVESYTFPGADGSSGQVMTTDGNGGLSWTDSAGGSSTDGIIFTGRYISPAEIATIGQNPIELLPAPGANKFIDVMDVIFKYNYGSTNYDVVTLAAGFGNDPEQFLYLSLNQSIRYQFDWFFRAKQNPSSSMNFIPNEAFKLSTLSSLDPGTNGDGTLEVYITYKIVDLLDL